MPIWSSWPSWWLPKLQGLTVFHLNPRNPSCLLPKLKPTSLDISQLPRSLLDLELGFVEAISDEDLILLPPGLTRLWLPYNTRISHSGLASLPKSLTILNLERNQIITDTKFIPSSISQFIGNAVALLPIQEVFQGLPIHLSKLKLVDPGKTLPGLGNISVDIFAKMVDLRSLSLTVPSVMDLFFSNLALPPYLEKLKLFGDGCAIPPEFLPKLPPTLTVLSMRPEISCELIWEDEQVPLLPSGLINLEFLPRNMHISTDCSTRLTTASFSLLPRSLTAFRIIWVRPHPTWDPTTSLQLALDDHTEHLPRTLTALHVCVKYRGKTSEPCDLTKLPMDLKEIFTLRCRINSDTPLVVPKQLRKLSLSGILPLPVPGGLSLFPPVSADTEIPYQWASSCGLFQNALYLHLFTTNKDVFTNLSSELVYLDLTSSFDMYDAYLLHLPDTLTCLKITGESKSGSKAAGLTDQCLPALPHDLRELHIGSRNRIAGNVFPFPKKLHTLLLGPCDLKAPYRPKYPPFLTSLTLASNQVSSESLYGLPSSITYFNIPNAEKLTGSITPLLPSSLLTLVMPNLELTDKDIGLLPRGIRKFSSRLGCNRLTAASAADWPPLLVYLEFSGVNFNPSAIPNLPRTLAFLQLREASVAGVSRPQIIEMLSPHLTRFTIGSYHS
jgi:Leucine-rich repeat (LRR) protein